MFMIVIVDPAESPEAHLYQVGRLQNPGPGGGAHVECLLSTSARRRRFIGVV